VPSRRNVFLSYRRQEASHLAGRLADRLVSQFGEAHVFIDVDSIAPGSDFGEAISRAVNECAVLLALIGPTWTSAVDAHGRRRLDDPDDLVVLELEAALDRAIPVIPVLVDGARAPTRDDLPAKLGGLARRQALRIDHDSFRTDCAALLSHITHIIAEAGKEQTTVHAARSDENRRTAAKAAADFDSRDQASETAPREQAQREQQAWVAHAQGTPQTWRGPDAAFVHRDDSTPMQSGAHMPLRAGPLGHLSANQPAEGFTGAQAHASFSAGLDRLPARSARRGWRRWRRVAAALTAVIVVAAGVIVAVLASRSGAESVTPPTAAPNVAIPDPIAADPCSLLDADSVRGFGATALDPDNVSFAACRADITRPDGGAIGFTITFENQVEFAQVRGGTRSEEDGFTIVRYPPDDGSCEQRILLADGNVIVVSAVRYEDPSGTADLCAIADAGRTATLSRLLRGGIGRQRVPLTAASPLASIPACSLLAPEEIAAAVANATPPRSSFGDWGCNWNSSTSSGSAAVTFYRGYPLGESDGRPSDFAGHSGTVLPREGNCWVQIVQRSYTAGAGDRIESVWVTYSGSGNGDQLCATATALATAVAGRLPPPS
jgi:TIR domain-containing protein/uncharacterized protein DUF3558